MLASLCLFSGVILNAFATHYARNYAGIIGSSLAMMDRSPFKKRKVALGWAHCTEIIYKDECMIEWKVVAKANYTEGMHHYW